MLSTSTYFRTPEMIPYTGYNDYFTMNLTAMMPFIKQNLSDLVQVSVGLSGPEKKKPDAIQPCITYNPPGPSPDKYVCM